MQLIEQQFLYVVPLVELQLLGEFVVHRHVSTLQLSETGVSHVLRLFENRIPMSFP
jgi:hypothetical protein